MSRHPEVKWAEREDKVFLTVMLPDAKNPKVNLEPNGDFTFSATAGPENHPYELKLNLHDAVNVEESKINIGVRNIFCVLEKDEKKWWKKLLRGDEKTPHYVKVDWDKWVDEDDDPATGPADFDMGGMDFSKFGDMGMGGMGMGGMDMGGMGDGLGDEDSDDEGQEITMPEKDDNKTEGVEAKLAEKESSEGKTDSK
ncbi:hypothetical protein M9H77_01662 [Catharanthus roseus]|uniref:Uncharacterized protein n=1 Tax=Catharanthus roseus TaxID=4058 RepID=A0ACC0C664_CATRO|nr:hypothetical protein M9H77_01662 [Catharanthus roseus]